MAEIQSATPPLVERKKGQPKAPDAAPPPPKKKLPPQVVQPPLQPAPGVAASTRAKAPPVLTRPPPAKPPDPAPVKPPATPTPKPPATPTTKPPDKPSGKPPAAAASDRWRPAAAGATAAVSAHSPAASSHSSSPQTPQSRRQIAEQILAAFTAQIPRTPPSAMYKLGILLTTGMMLLLPLIYVGLIALAAGIVLWHLSANVGMLTAISGRGAILGVIAYVAPAVMGAVLVLFMIKPLFARSGEHEKSRTLSRQSDPLVFAFVEKVCATVQAPVPSQIDVNCEVNASAGFRSGLASFAGQDMVLTIGMPLVAGLSLQQFAGVLAHEFGHFSQGTGMRLTYVTRTINMWLMRVVYERDAWDMWLDNVTESVDIRIGWVLYLTRFLVWLTRRVLWLLMLLGHAVSGFMLREMEYDADRFEARLAGSQTFEATVRQLIYLNMAHQGAQADLENFYREGRLADNLPRLIIVNVAQLPDEARKYADEYIEKAETSVFDSHPADRDRIASARRENAAGVFASDLPATVLFEDFDAVAKAATWDLYSELFGAEFKPTAVRPIEEMLERQSREEQIYEAMKRYLLDSFQVLRPLRVSEWYLRPPTNSPDVQNRLAWARNEMQAHIAPYNEAWQQYDKADSRMIQMRQLAPLLARGCRIMADHFEHVPASATAAGYERDRAFADMNHLDARLAPLESAAGQRLQAALLLLHHPQFAARLADARELLEHCQRLMPLVGKINTHLSQIVELRNNHAILSALVGHIEDNEQNEGLFQEVVAQLERTHRQLGGLWDVFKSEAYPFDHQEGFMSISHFLLKKMPTPQELGGTLDGVDRVLASLASLYRRALARLCYIAERVETSLGWEPLPMPEKIVAP
jgi:Zn-dependent protease with chaperone function